MTILLYIIEGCLVIIATGAVLLGFFLLLKICTGKTTCDEMDEYNVLVFTENVLAGQAITKTHIDSIILNEDEYDTLTSATFEVKPDGKGVIEIPVPYERREEVFGLIAKADYAAGTIITYGMVVDQRTVTNGDFNTVDQNCVRVAADTTDGDTGPSTVKMYALVPGEPVKVVSLMGEDTILTDHQVTALLNGDTGVLVNKLVFMEVQKAAEKSQAAVDNRDITGGECELTPKPSFVAEPPHETGGGSP